MIVFYYHLSTKNVKSKCEKIIFLKQTDRVHDSGEETSQATNTLNDQKFIL